MEDVAFLHPVHIGSIVEFIAQAGDPLSTASHTDSQRRCPQMPAIWSATTNGSTDWEAMSLRGPCGRSTAGHKMT